MRSASDSKKLKRIRPLATVPAARERASRMQTRVIIGCRNDLSSA